MTEFLQRLKQRKLVQWAAAYAAGAWALLQVLDMASNSYGWPTLVMRLGFGVVALGFVFTLLLAWYHGERGEQKISGTELLLLALVLAVGSGFLWKFVGNASQPSESDVSVAPLVPQSTQSAAAEPHSIAVLPFVNMSSDKEQEYFSDGLSEELLNQLAQISQLRVIARTSSFSFKGKEVAVAEIAKALNVANVLEGSVRKSGDTLRITAQLIRTSDSSHLWSQTYDRKLTDVFKVQDEISREVVAALKLKLLPGKQPDHTQRTQSPEAYELYLIAMDSYRAAGRGNVEAAVVNLRRAIAIDPGYANAYAQLGNLGANLADFAETPALRESTLAQAMDDTDRAIALAPDLSDGYIWRGNIRYRMRWDWQGAQVDLARALALSPNDAVGLTNYAAVLFTLGRREEGLAAMRKAVVSDPLSESVWSAFGRFLDAAGERPEAKQAYTRALEINPQQNWANFLLGNMLLADGNTDGAISHYQRAPEQFQTTGMAMAEFTRGNEAASRQSLEKMEKDFAVGFAYQIAQIYAWRGENDRAFEWLDRCFPVHDAGLVRLPFDPWLDPLRKDPRFAVLVTRMGFPK